MQTSMKRFPVPHLRHDAALEEIASEEFHDSEKNKSSSFQLLTSSCNA